MGRQDRRCESPSTRAQRPNGGRVFLGAAAPVIANGFGRTKAHKTSLLDTAMDSSTVIFVAALLLRDAVRSRRRWLPR